MMKDFDRHYNRSTSKHARILESEKTAEDKIKYYAKVKKERELQIESGRNEKAIQKAHEVKRLKNQKVSLPKFSWDKT